MHAGTIYSIGLFEGSITVFDVLHMTITGFIPLIITVPLMIKLFQNKNIENNTKVTKTFNFKNIAIKLGIIGIVYLTINYLFWFFVLWQFEEFRAFYSTTSGQILWGGNDNGFFVNFIFQLFIGIIMGIFTIYLSKMITKNKITFIISICLIYLCPAIMSFSNQIVPDTIRILLSFQLICTMIIFGIIVGIILWEKIERIELNKKNNA